MRSPVERRDFRFDAASDSDYRLGVTFSRIRPCAATRWIAVVALAGLAAGPLQAGEKMRFSGRRGAMELPAWKEQLQGLSLAPDKLSPGGASDALAIPTGAPSAKVVADPRQLDQLERRKNWMFQTGEKDKAARPDATDRKDEETERTEGKSKSSIDRFWDDRDRKALTKKEQAAKEQAAKDLPVNKDRDPGARFAPQRESTVLTTSAKEGADGATAATAKDGSEAGLPGTDREAVRGAPGAAGFKELNPMNRLATERRDQQREHQRESQLADFGKLINPAAPAAPARGADAFGLGGDAARAGVNPVGGRGGPDFTRRDDFLGAGAGAGLPGMAGPRFSGRDDFSPRLPGGSALLPEPPRPAESLRVQPKPTILEIPRRKI